jgi:molecular chaperone HscB
MNDHFHRLGLPRRFVLDAGELERAYLTRSRAVHPDYHLAGSAADLGASLDLSAAVNEAYNTLRDPFARAEHLLMLEGGPGAGEHKQMPPAFLAEMLEAREQIEEARVGCPDDAAMLDASFAARSDAIMDEVGALFAKLEEFPPDDPQRVNLRQQIRGLLNAARYIRGLLRDLHADQE